MHTHPFDGPLSRTIQVSRYQKGKTNLDFYEARDSEWQWHQLGCMQVCTSRHTSTPPLSFLQARCPSCHPNNSGKALKAQCVISVEGITAGYASQHYSVPAPSQDKLALKWGMIEMGHCLCYLTLHHKIHIMASSNSSVLFFSRPRSDG